MGINPQWLDMHRGGHHKFLPEGLLLGFQIRQMLKIVGIHLTMGQQLIGVHPIGDLDHLQIQLRIDFLYIRQDLRMGYRVHCHPQRFLGQGTEGSQQRAKHSQGQASFFEHGAVLNQALSALGIRASA